MYQAQAVLKTKIKDKFESAEFKIEVELDPNTDEVAPHSMTEMYRIIKEGWCDGFIIDLGDHKQKHIIKS